MSSSQSQSTSSSSTTPLKRSATARMHAVSAKKQRTNDDSPQLPLPTALDQTPPGTVKSNIGECPPYNDHSAWVEDTCNNTIYMFGGTRPGDQDSIPTSDFYKCDARTMGWENLTDKLRFRNPSDPFSCEELLREKRCLPELSGPGLTLMRINNTSFILIFGGHSVDEDKAVSTLIAVDVDHREWWYVRVEGGHVAARINPVVVAVEHKLYIFSGFKTFSKKQCHPFKSYSIATYSAPRGGWHWEARDVSYSGLDHQLFGAGLPVYDGKKILLTPGKLYYQEDCERLDFSKKKLYYFHTEHRQFQVAPHFGDFPKEVLWYSIHKPPPSRPPLPSRIRVFNRGPASGSSTLPGPSSSPLSPFIVICAWIPRHNSKYAVPEFWRLSLSHNDEIRCLNKSDKIWDLNQDFQGCVSTKEGITLLGNNSPKGEERWNIHLRLVLTAEDLQDK